MDLFVALFKRDREGRVVGFAHYAQFEDGPVALGWLRVSHRELDEERSEPFLPVLAHRRELPMDADGPTRGWSRSSRRARCSSRASRSCSSSRGATS